jgi:hypothetical protein
MERVIMRFPKAAYMPDDGHGGGHGGSHGDSHGNGDHGQHAEPSPAPIYASSSGETPVWARRASRGGGGGGFFMFIFMIFALIGGLFLVLRFMDHSFEAAGARVDGWVRPAVDYVARATGQAGDTAEEAADAAGDTAEAAGDAIEEAGEAAQDPGAPAQPATK